MDAAVLSLSPDSIEVALRLKLSSWAAKKLHLRDREFIGPPLWGRFFWSVGVSVLINLTYEMGEALFIVFNGNWGIHGGGYGMSFNLKVAFF